MEGWLNLGKFVISTFGLPGAMIAGMLAYSLWLLKQERDDHKATRKQVDEVNEKRIELLTIYLKTMADFKTSVDALSAIVGKGK